MKNYLIFFIIWSNFGLSAQYNLQFNQVLTFNGSFQGTVTVGVVPLNKVWKIEAYSIATVVTKINGTQYHSVLESSNGSYVRNNNPIWLKAGDVLTVTSIPECCNTREYFYSIIEFNVGQ